MKLFKKAVSLLLVVLLLAGILPTAFAAEITEETSTTAETTEPTQLQETEPVATDPTEETAAPTAEETEPAGTAPEITACIRNEKRAIFL